MAVRSTRRAFACAITALVLRFPRAAEAQVAAAPPRAAPHATAAFGEKGRKDGLRPAAGESVERITGCIDQKDGPSLRREIEKLLAAGESGYVELAGILAALEQDGGSRAMLLSSQYELTFAASQLAMLHEVEVAELLHYFFAASEPNPRSFLRTKFYDLVPDFLRFHAGRFPDLERYFREDIDRQLTLRAIDPQRVLGAARTLEYRPDLVLVEDLLLRSTGLGMTQAATAHLGSRDDDPAAAVLGRFLTARPQAVGPEKAAVFTALAGMSAPLAGRILQRSVFSDDPETLYQAASAYFSSPRDPRSLRAVLRLLNNSRLDIRQKRAFLAKLRKHNLEILDLLVESRNQVQSPDVRALVEP